MATGDETIYANGGLNAPYGISLKFTPNRDKLRLAVKVNDWYTLDSIAGLSSNPNGLDLLEWFEVLVSLKTTSGQQRHQMYINGIDYFDQLEPGSPNTPDEGVPHSDTVNATIGGRQESGDFNEQLGGEIQEIWIAATSIDLSQQANRDAFSLAGVPQELGVNGEAAGVTPYIYLNGKLGQDFLNNHGSLGGAFSEAGTLTEGSTSPLQPGATPPQGGLVDDTFKHVDALFGNVTAVPAAGYGVEQSFTLANDLDSYDAIASQMLTQTLTSPVTTLPLSFEGGAGLTGGHKGGLIRRTDPFDATHAQMDGSAGYKNDVDVFVYDGCHVFNTADNFRVLGSAESDALNSPPLDGDGDLIFDENGDIHGNLTGNSNFYFQVWNSRCTYGRGLAINNTELLAGHIEDCLFDGIYAFLKATNGGSTQDHSVERSIVIRNCLIWLRRLPYPQQHPTGGTLGTDPINGTDEDIWGHGRLFNWIDNGPLVKIEDCIFYIEDYGALAGAYGTWPSAAASTIGILADNPNNLGECSNNKIIFGHPSDTYSVNWIPAAQQSAFTITNFSADANAPQEFFAARNRWLAEHPLVMGTGQAIFDNPIDYGASLIQPYVPYPTF